MDRTWGHYVKWNEPNSESQCSCILSYVKTKEEKRVGELRKIEERTVQQRREPGRERKREVLGNETDQLTVILCECANM